MSLQPVQLPQPLLLVPPLVLRTRNGFLGPHRVPVSVRLA
jgi:hypothetical protein